MEQKNENEILILKNYSNFLLDLGMNISFSNENDLKIKQGNLQENFKNIKDIDNYINEWQVKNDFHFILRNNNISSKVLLLLSEENNFMNFEQFKQNQPELLVKMFASIGQNIDNFFTINIDFSKKKNDFSSKMNKILKLYFTILNPKTFINMCSDDLNNFIELDKFNLNFDYFKIPSVSSVIKNPILKQDAWAQLKLLKVKLNELQL